MSERRCYAQSEMGFTLIELMASLSLLGLIAVTTAFAIRFGTRAWERADANVQSIDGAMRVETLLREELSSTYPGYVGDGPTDSHLDFTGASDHLEFLTQGPRVLISAGRARVLLKTTNSSRGLDLIWTAGPELAADTNMAPATETLASRLAMLEFSYFGSQRGEPAAWHSQWTDSMKLPQLIRIRAEFQDQSTWPELLIVPRITASVGCRLDPLTHDCRGS